MYLDALLKVSDSQDIKANGAKFSTSSIDLKQSPDIGLGTQLVAVILIETYTSGGTNTQCVFDVIVGDQAAFGGTNRIVATKTLSTTQLEAADDATVNSTIMPIVMRLDPDMLSELTRSGGTERYLGLNYTCSGVATAFTVSVSFMLADALRSDPKAGMFASGFTAL